MPAVPVEPAYYAGRETLIRYEAVIIHKRGLPGTPMGTIWNSMKSKGLTWFMHSLGPSRRWNTCDGLGGGMNAALEGQLDTATQPRCPSMYYDATNGTISLGRIVRSNRGLEPVK